ncbi:uncharacterized protein FIBRA_02646 [Fibroporia radiculosa]|uniref:F-box domain-containing protein n=1 Tax=Fibroporia radiculosa TaxID=599839 RepID=J4GN09_9APHY|nr:uncharacterized protein FIBRA_02646 [Fibroporia radiculosa]CCM00610.1 predicted protein [Fibroporia radiculosa]
MDDVLPAFRVLPSFVELDHEYHHEDVRDLGAKGSDLRQAIKFQLQRKILPSEMSRFRFYADRIRQLDVDCATALSMPTDILDYIASHNGGFLFSRLCALSWTKTPVDQRILPFLSPTLRSLVLNVAEDSDCALVEIPARSPLLRDFQLHGRPCYAPLFVASFKHLRVAHIPLVPVDPSLLRALAYLTELVDLDIILGDVMEKIQKPESLYSLRKLKLQGNVAAMAHLLQYCHAPLLQQVDNWDGCNGLLSDWATYLAIVSRRYSASLCVLNLRMQVNIKPRPLVRLLKILRPLQSLSSLREFRFSHNFRANPIAVLEDLAHAWPLLTKFSFDHFFIRYSADIDTLYKLISLWPQLEHLSLPHVDFSAPNPTLVKVASHRLRYIDIGFQRGNIARLSGWLVSMFPNLDVSEDMAIAHGIRRDMMPECFLLALTISKLRSEARPPKPAFTSKLPVAVSTDYIDQMANSVRAY